MPNGDQLRGSHSATVDDKGRIKVPADFRKIIRARHGDELFLTSFTGESLRAYPLAAWRELEDRVARLPAMHPVRQKLETWVNYYGHMARMDKQGRVVIPQLVRESAKLDGEVVIMGKIDHLEVWNHKTFRGRLAAQRLTEADFQTLADLGI